LHAQRTALLLAVAVLFLGSTTWAQANICPNPGMETSNPSWMSGTWPDRWEKNLPYMIGNEVYVWEADGTGITGRCISITNPSGGVFPVGNARTSGVRWISTADGLVLDGTKKYDVSVYIKKTSDVKVRLFWIWYSGAKIALITGSGAWDGATPGGDWAQITASPGKPPLGAVYLEFNFEIVPNNENTVNTGTVYFDDSAVAPSDTGDPAYGSLSGQVTYAGAGVANAIVGVKTTANALTDGGYYTVTDALGNYTLTLASPGIDPTTYYAAAVKVPWMTGESTYVAYTAAADQTFQISSGAPGATVNLSLAKKLGQQLQLRSNPIIGTGTPADESGKWRLADRINQGGDAFFGNAVAGGTAYVCLDLGAGIPVSLINFCQWFNQRAVDWTLDCSDDLTNWTTVASGTGSQGGFNYSARYQLIRIAPEVTARYWRMTRNTAAAGQWIIPEFEVYSAISGTVQGQVTAGGSPFNKAIVGVKYRRGGNTGATLSGADFWTVTDASGNFTVPVSNGTFDVAAWPHQESPYPYVEAWAPTYGGQVTVSDNTQTINVACTEGLGGNLAKTTDTNLVVTNNDAGRKMQVFDGNRRDGTWDPGSAAGMGYCQVGDRYIYRDLGATPPAIDVIVLAWLSNREHRQYTVSYSDDATNWTTAYEALYSGGHYNQSTGGVINGGGFPAWLVNTGVDGMWETIRLAAPITARYWKIQPVARNQATDWNALHEIEFYNITAAPGKISGYVTVGGVPISGAIVGIKAASKGGYALADGDTYVTTAANGFYQTATLGAGDYLVAAWPSTNNPDTEKYAMSAQVTVSVNGDKTQSFNITKGLGPDVAKTTDQSAVLGSEGSWHPNPWNGWDVVFNSSRYGGDYWNPSTPGAWIYRDFGSNPPAIDTIVIGQGGDYYATSYVVETSSDAAAWAPAYTETNANGGYHPGDRAECIRLSAPITARYWRLRAISFIGANWWVSNVELYGTIAGLPGKIEGIINVRGVPREGAVVGVKTAPAATADALYFYDTDASGHFGPTPDLSYGTYYVGAWVDGYLVKETSVVVDATTTSVTLDLTELSGFNDAYEQQTLATTFATLGGDPPSEAAAPVLVDGGHIGGDAWFSGDNDQFLPADPPLWAWVDLGDNKPVNQVFIDWMVTPRSYKIQYFQDDGSGFPPASDDPLWTDWYTCTYPDQSGAGFYFAWMAGHGPHAVIRRPQGVGRWWRIWTEDPRFAGDPGRPMIAVREFQVYDAVDVPCSVGGVIKTAGGSPIYNAVVHLEKTGGGSQPQNVVTDTDGRYEFAGLPIGDYSVASDALGYSPAQVTFSLAGGEVRTQDLTLDARSETGAYNAGMEEADGTLPKGWRAWPDNAPGIDYYRYTGEKKTGSACFACNRTSGSADPNTVAAMAITPDKWVSVAYDKAYNVYFWAKSDPPRGDAWSVIWRDAAGNEIGRLIYPGWFMSYASTWKAYVLAYRAVPPTGSVYMDVHVIPVFGTTEDPTHRFLLDDVVVDEATTAASPPSNMIGDAKKMPLGSSISIFTKVVTGICSQGGSANGIPDGFIYIEDSDRSSGIIVGIAGIPEQIPADLAVGDTVNVSGILVNTRPGTNDGELAITADTLVRPDLVAPPILPLGMNVGAAWGAPLAPGLLVAVAGTWSTENLAFWIGDGSTTGKLKLDATGLPISVTDGTFTKVIGIVGIDFVTGERVIRIRGAADVVGPYPPIYP